MTYITLAAHPFMRITLPILFATAFSITSCSISVGGLTSGRRSLSSKDRASIGVLDTSRNRLPSTGFYPVTASILKKYMSSVDTSMVYLWVPFCHGTTCYPLRTFVDYARKHHYQLFIVADEYDMEFINPQLADDFPTFVLDYNYYHTNWRGKCRKRFIQELLGKQSVPDSILYANKFYFANGRFLRCKEDID